MLFLLLNSATQKPAWIQRPDREKIGNKKEALMPIYEYRCNRCKKVFSQLFMNAKEVEAARCRYCNARGLTRLLSSFSIHQNEESRLKNVDTTKRPSDEFYKDSRNVGLWTKKRIKEMGVDLGPKLDEIVEKGRTGKILDDYQ